MITNKAATRRKVSDYWNLHSESFSRFTRLSRTTSALFLPSIGVYFYWRWRLRVHAATVVITTFDDPIPGWIDNFNGPMAIGVAAGKGVVHSIQWDPVKYINCIPCDITVKGLIISSCDISRRGVGDLPVYHAAQIEEDHFTFGDLMEISYEITEESPFKDTLYYPVAILTGNNLYFYTFFIISQLLPGILIDALLCATRHKPILLRLQRRIYLGCQAIAWFNTQNWNFLNKRFMRLEDKLAEGDREDFAFNAHRLTPREIVRRVTTGARLYLLHENDADLPLARRRHKRNHIIHLLLKTLFFAAVLWIILPMLHSIFWRFL